MLHLTEEEPVDLDEMLTTQKTKTTGSINKEMLTTWQIEQA